MESKECNALAELSEDLEVIVKDTESDFYSTRIRTAQLIVAELAKVPDLANLIGATRPDLFASSDAVIKCRAIAEEGVNNDEQ